MDLGDPDLAQVGDAQTRLGRTLDMGDFLGIQAEQARRICIAGHRIVGQDQLLGEEDLARDPEARLF